MLLRHNFYSNQRLSSHQAEILGLIVFSAIFLAVRLTNLTLLPPYVDEGLHISRAVTVLKEGRLLIHTEGGKFLQIWLISLMLVLKGDPFWDARAGSVLVGLLSFIGCYFLGKTLFQRRMVGWVAALLYQIIPFAFFLDRLALNDNLLAMLGIYIFFFSIKLVQSKNIWPMLGLGLTLGLAALTKLDGFVLWIIPLLTLIAWQAQTYRLWQYPLMGAYIVAITIGSPVIFLLPEQLSSPADKTWFLNVPPPTSLALLWVDNFQRIWLFFQTYLTWPIMVMVLFGVILTLVRRHRNGLLLVEATFIYCVFFNLVSIQLYSRYLFPVVPFLLILAGYGVVSLSDWLLVVIGKIRLPLAAQETYTSVLSCGSLVILLALPAFHFDYQLLFNPTQAPLEAHDHWLFVNSWLSGYGLQETSVFLKAQAADLGPITVVRHDTAGLTQEGLDLTLANMRDTIKLVTLNFHVESPNHLTKLIEREQHPTFVVLSLPQVPGAAPFTVDFSHTPYCHEAAKFFKPDYVTYVAVYECQAPQSANDQKALSPTTSTCLPKRCANKFSKSVCPATCTMKTSLTAFLVATSTASVGLCRRIYNNGSS